MIFIMKPLEEYHRQRDALVGKTADHLKPPTTYSRGTVIGEDIRSRKRFWWLKLIVRGLIVAILAIAFFAALFIISEVIVSTLG